MRRVAELLAVLLTLALAATAAAQVPRWQRWETQLESARDYKQPLHEMQVTVDLVGPGGAKATVDAFWDGGRVWKVRFAPTEPGEWRWTTRASDAANTGLHGRSG